MPFQFVLIIWFMNKIHCRNFKQLSSVNLHFSHKTLAEMESADSKLSEHHDHLLGWCSTAMKQIQLPILSRCCHPCCKTDLYLPMYWSIYRWTLFQHWIFGILWAKIQLRPKKNGVKTEIYDCSRANTQFCVTSNMSNRRTYEFNFRFILHFEMVVAFLTYCDSNIGSHLNRCSIAWARFLRKYIFRRILYDFQRKLMDFLEYFNWFRFLMIFRAYLMMPKCK